MKYKYYTKRDPVKNYFKVPNEVFDVGLEPLAIVIYCYLLRVEDRKDFTCYPSYKTIGKHVGLSKNTVAKYVRSLEEKGFIRTEESRITRKDGMKRNGSLHYTILPPQNFLNENYERQFRKMDSDLERQRVDSLIKEFDEREEKKNAV